MQDVVAPFLIEIYFTLRQPSTFSPAGASTVFGRAQARRPSTRPVDWLVIEFDIKLTHEPAYLDTDGECRCSGR